MARPWRIEFEGALYHVLSRGNGREDIYYDDQDRHLFLKTVGEMSDRFEIDVYREKMQEYAKEEKKLWEDLRHCKDDKDTNEGGTQSKRTI